MQITRGEARPPRGDGIWRRGGEGLSPLFLPCWSLMGKSCPGRRNSLCKGPEAVSKPMCWKNIKELNGIGSGEVRGFEKPHWGLQASLGVNVGWVQQTSTELCTESLPQ